MIAIVDYGAGNLTSVVKAIQHLGQECVVTNDPDIVGRADEVDHPWRRQFQSDGAVGEWELGAVLRDAAQSDGRPLLGICLGLQWMFEGSSEAPELRGLATFAGECTRFSERVKSPHVGWDSIAIDARSRLLAGILRARMCISPIPIARRCAATRWRLVRTKSPLPRRRSGATCSACNFIPRSRAMWALQILENFCAL